MRAVDRLHAESGRKWLEAGRRLRCPDAACDGAVTVKAPPA